MKILVDLNCDMGESFGNYKIGQDEDIVSYITSANIACGFHASDPLVMQKTIALCKDADVAPGAHPGFPDLVGFGTTRTFDRAFFKRMGRTPDALWY